MIKLFYRGVRYEARFTQTATTESPITAKYRGLVYRVRSAA